MAAAALALGAGAGGCARWEPVDVAGASARGTAARVTLTAAGTRAVVDALGPGVVALDGTVRVDGDGRWRVTASRLLDAGGRALPIDPRELTLERASVAGVAARRTDAGRTALAVGGVAAGGALFWSALRAVTTRAGGGGGADPGAPALVR